MTTKRVERSEKPGLSKRRIDALMPTGARRVVWDDDVVGLGLRVYPKGRKAFVVMYRDAGNAKRLATIGDYGVFTLEQAREQAKAMLRDAETGKDAMKVRRAQKAAPTFGDLIDRYKAQHVPRKRSGAEDVRRINRHLLAWKSRKLTTITRADVQSLVNRIGKDAPYEGNRLHALVSKMFAQAERWDMLPNAYPNPAKGVERAPEVKRERWATPQPLPTPVRAVEVESASNRRAVVLADNLRLRDAQSSRAGVLGRLRRGHRVAVLGWRRCGQSTVASYSGVLLVPLCDGSASRDLAGWWGTQRPCRVRLSNLLRDA